GLLEQGPETGGSDQTADDPDDRARSDGRPGEGPHDGECEIDEPAVEVLPRAVGLSRPQDRHAVPGDEPSGEARKREPLPAERRRRKDSPERSRARSDRRQYRAGADPGNRPDARTTSKEERGGEEHAGRREQGQRSRPHRGEATTRASLTNG